MSVLGELWIGDSVVILRRAVKTDVAAIVSLLVDDELGSTREISSDPAPYLAAFHLIDADPAHLLLVVIDDEEVVATLQLTFLPGLARRGAFRAQIEAVRVRHDYRSRGLGSAMFTWAISESRRRGCALVQLTTDKTRSDAHRFYAGLGFTASHEGFKLPL